jgi:hypothetical protein
MPNPNRPQYQDTIESAWGQSVADHVIRRYATAAERDADLTGMTPAQLAGQLVTLNPTPGDSSLWVHDGSSWRVRPTIKAGLTTATTNSGSVCTILFAKPFPAGYQVFGMVQVKQATQAFFTDGFSGSLNGFTTTVLGQSGGGIGQGFPLAFNWIALGFPAGAAANESGREATEDEAAEILAQIEAASS